MIRIVTPWLGGLAALLLLPLPAQAQRPRATDQRQDRFQRVLVEVNRDNLSAAERELETLERDRTLKDDPDCQRHFRLTRFVILAARTTREQGAQLSPLLEGAQARAAETEPEDLPLLDWAMTALGTNGGQYVELIRRASYKAIRPQLGWPRLIALARERDPRVRGLAVSALAELLSRTRAVVTKGGTLTREQQATLSSPALIQLLIERLEDRPQTGATDELPANMAVRSPGTATALHALTLIEAAALPALRAVEGSAGTTEAIAAIERAIKRRLRRHPASTWSSAKGVPPLVLTRAISCCGKTLLPAARFCPDCGEEARPPCTLCGHLLPHKEATSCHACGAGRKPPRPPVVCDGCGAGSRNPGKFCIHCGHSQIELE